MFMYTHLYCCIHTCTYTLYTYVATYTHKCVYMHHIFVHTHMCIYKHAHITHAHNNITIAAKSSTVTGQTMMTYSVRFSESIARYYIA